MGVAVHAQQDSSHAVARLTDLLSALACMPMPAGLCLHSFIALVVGSTLQLDGIVASTPCIRVFCHSSGTVQHAAVLPYTFPEQ